MKTVKFAAHNRVSGGNVPPFFSVNSLVDNRVSGNPADQGYRTRGGSDERIDSTLPPVFRPKIVPRS